LVCVLAAWGGAWIAAEAIAPGPPARQATRPPTGGQRALLEARLLRSPEGGTIDRGWYERALAHMERMPQRDSTRGPGLLPSRREIGAEREALAIRADALAGRMTGPEIEVLGWTPLGPGNIGGRTRSLAIHPGRPDVVFAAGVAGGVWRSDNRGLLWAPTGGMANLAVTALAFHPTSIDTLYAGTGEDFPSGMPGAGVFRTTNGGGTWKRLAGTPATDPNFQFVSDLQVSPTDPNVLYAATSTGVWRSRNAGQSFALFLDPRNVSGCQDLAVRVQKSADVLFAACGKTEQGRVWRHTNAAGFALDGWAIVLADPAMGRTALAIAPSHPDTIYAVAATLGTVPDREGFHGLFRSTTGGGPGSWSARSRGTTASRITQTLLSDPRPALADLCTPGATPSWRSQGDWDLVVAVDPVDQHRIWVGAVDLFRSDNGGAGFGPASYWDGQPRANYAHADQHALLFHPGYDGVSNKILYVGNDGGVFATIDATRPVATTASGVCSAADPGAAQIAWLHLANNYQVTQFYYGMPTVGDTSRYLGGTQDNGTVAGRDDADVPINGWQSLVGGDGGAVWSDGELTYASAQDGVLYRSLDGGPFVETNTPREGAFPFITYFVVGPERDDLWWPGRRLWRSRDRGDSWVAMTPALPRGEIFTAVGVDPRDPEHVVIASDTGRVWRSFDALSATNVFDTVWLKNRIVGCRIRDLEFDPVHPDTVYAACTTLGRRHVWRSTDRGRSWLPADGANAAQRLPDVAVLALAVDNRNGQIFAGTDLGVFSTTDAGLSWAIERTGFPNTQVTDLTLTDVSAGGLRVRNLFAFTHGRGAFRGQLR
jgi:hypothetical protein